MGEKRKTMTTKVRAILFAFLAAVFYAINVPISKVLLAHVGPTTMAALLYLGAGIGIGGLSLMNRNDREMAEGLSKPDLPYVLGMIVLDIAAPIFLMLGVSHGTSANASLLGNFEIVATTIIALFIFKEAVSKRLWLAIALITLSSILLSLEGTDSFQFSSGSLFVIAATICWGFENNCTRKISSKSTYEIVVLKGIFSGLGSLVIALVLHEKMPAIRYVIAALVLGFVSYGLSIFLYVRAQNVLGAAKTSAYYAVAPFIGALLSFVFLKESLSWTYLIALTVMIVGSVLVVVDTLIRHHAHLHSHTFTHTHDGTTHTHTVTHSHEHDHITTDEKHGHHHSVKELENEMKTE
ncbi:MAG: DMT family transporter [Lachnospiraceae bacterium]|nr:DMT family transporter [Lachnospiraceae bacterium]